MKIYLETSGGIANLRLRGELDGSRLPPELRRRVDQLLQSAKSESAARPGNPFLADGMSYRLVITPEGGEPREIELREGASHEEALATARELQRELVRMKKGK